MVVNDASAISPSVISPSAISNIYRFTLHKLYGLWLALILSG
jgi:hypothetical protein